MDSKDELENQLYHFIYAIKKQDGSDYHTSSLNNCFHSINHHLNKKSTLLKLINLLNKEKYYKLWKVYNAKVKNLASNGEPNNIQAQEEKLYIPNIPKIINIYELYFSKYPTQERIDNLEIVLIGGWELGDIKEDFLKRSLNTPERFLEYRFEGRRILGRFLEYRFEEAKPAVVCWNRTNWDYAQTINNRFLSAFGIGYLNIGFCSALDTEYQVSASIFSCSCGADIEFGLKTIQLGNFLEWEFLVGLER
ncbi:hypothetical protein RhiirA4_548378 [Rhizophagus irregularis]|uniref:Uncharacterized protein n=1 Tax=Rhizophagus irregularis TaxID=588596 RepID=A0A2I1H788_9GLOM|nr:hypothetical protein RhiirA4_548378 [Rhizophagus irregularis]